MGCVKTGIKFCIDWQEETYHGDMYYYKEADCFVITGIAQMTSHFETHITLTLAKDEETYKVLAKTPSFIAWMNDWNNGLSLDKPVLIIDPRFR